VRDDPKVTFTYFVFHLTPCTICPANPGTVFYGSEVWSCFSSPAFFGAAFSVNPFREQLNEINNTKERTIGAVTRHSTVPRQVLNN